MNAHFDRIRVRIRWLFSTPLAAPAWFAIRIYLGVVWIRFGWGKIDDGWLQTDAMGPLLKAIAHGATTVPVEAYREVAGLLASLGVGPILSILVPLAEILFAAAFFSGVMVGPAAVAASLLNANLILSGVASIHFDGRIIALQLLLAAAWRTSGYLGLADPLRQLGRDYRQMARRVRRA